MPAIPIIRPELLSVSPCWLSIFSTTVNVFHETFKVSKYYELSVTGSQILTFTFIKRKFIIVGSEVIELEGITSFTNRQLFEEQNCSTDGNELIFGKNLIDVDVPEIGTILYNEVLSPFHIFQLFSIILWMSFVRIWLKLMSHRLDNNNAIIAKNRLILSQEKIHR